MDMKDRIFAARKAADMTQQQLADATKNTRGAVAQWEAGDTRPRHTTLAKIAKATGKPLEWLESGIDATDSSMRVVGEVAAGLWKEAKAMLNTYNMPVTPHPSYPAAAQRLYKVTGNSLDRIAPDGAYIHCVALSLGDTKPVHRDIVVVKTARGEATEYTVRRLFIEHGKQILRAECTNIELHDDIEIDKEDSDRHEITDIVIAAWSPIPRGTP